MGVATALKVLALVGPKGALSERPWPPELPVLTTTASGVAESCMRGDVAAKGKPDGRGERPPRGECKDVTPSAVDTLRTVPTRGTPLSTCLASSCRPENGGDHTTPSALALLSPATWDGRGRN